MFSAKDTLLTRPSTGGYQISRSLRFNSADTAYLNRTPASAGNRRKWTFSAWVKRSGTGDQKIFSGGTGTGSTDYIQLFFGGTTDSLRVSTYVADLINTTSVYRDYSAWYHIVWNIDTDNATATNRMQLYVNNTLITTANVTGDLGVNQTQQHSIGSNNYGAYFNGYMTEINFIDGQALTPSSFGETNAQTGVWQPKAFAGTYGTNGFYLNFSDNSNTTAATLGKDYSGNGNNWTPNNFSVTAGINNDSMVDSPTPYGVDTGAGGTVRGNYCTMNPLSAGSYVDVSNGNLQIVGNTSTNSGIALSTIGVTTGLWYWETTCVATGGLSYAGFGKLNSGYSSLNDAEAFLASYGGGYRNGGQIYGADRQITTTTGFGNGDIIGIALDMTNGAAYLSLNGTFLNSGVPTSGSSKTGAVWAWTPSSMPYAICPVGGGYQSSSNYLNMGQRPFAYTAPSGFKALCTQNLPTPTIGATSATLANTYFNPVLYTGNGATNTVTGVGFQPDFVWAKGRSGATSHALYDAVRGVQKRLVSNNAGDQATDTTGLSAFGSDGFTTGALAEINTSAATYVAWNWKANGAGSTNTSGSITSTVSASTASGFSVVTYTGTGGNATIGHGLGVAPQLIFVKGRDTSTADWFVYTSTQAATKYLILNTTAAVGTDTTAWNSTAPTSTVFSVGGAYSTSWSAKTYVAYCFAPIAGYSAFGSYTGNGSADGPFVYTGFRPAFIITKRTDSTSDWQLMDSSRNTYNVANTALFPNTADADASGYSKDFLSNGFKIRDSGASLNASAGTYIYIAFASNPFKYSLAR